MKLRYLIQVVVILTSLLLIVRNANAQMYLYSFLHIHVGDDQGGGIYTMVFGNHAQATYGLDDSLWTYWGIVSERESPPLPPGLGVVWRPARSGVSWGLGLIRYDIREYIDIEQKDTFKLYFANAMAPDANITLSWPDTNVLREKCTALVLKVDTNYYDMFAQSSITILDAGDYGIAQAYIYKTGAFPDRDLDVKIQILNMPEKFVLSNNYPNPFNPSTQITYSVPKATKVTLKIYDVLGREIAVLVNENKQPGEYEVTWNAEGVPSGVYFYRIMAGDYIETKKMVVVR